MKILSLSSIWQGHERSINIKKNIIASLFLKGVSIGISFLLVPMTLDYLDKERYGLWLTLSSIIGWFNLFDLGLGNGFRNKFSEAITKGDKLLAKIYVSTTFAVLSLIIVFVLIGFLMIQPLLDWTKILNTSSSYKHELSILVIIVFVFFCLQFIFKLINTILLADQKAALSDFLVVLGNFLSLIIIYVLIKISDKSLIMLGTAVSACPLLVLIIAFFVMFGGRYKAYRPSFAAVNFKYSKNLAGLGIQFFITQIAGLIVFSTSNIILSQLLGPAEVTTYNIAFKYFSIATMFFQIVITPFWSAYTEAYIKGDIGWIKNTMRKLIITWAGFCLVALVMLLAAPLFYKIWIGKEVRIPFTLSLFLAIYVCVGNWNNIFVAFNCGASKVRVQMLLSLFAGFINIPLSIFFVKFAGVSGVVIGMMLSIIPGSYISPLQYTKIIKGSAAGIWNK